VFGRSDAGGMPLFHGDKHSAIDVTARSVVAWRHYARDFNVHMMAASFIVVSS
jgi:hypothetical protein